MDELDPQNIRRARRPYALEVSGKRMDSKRRMAFVVIQLAQRFDEPTLITTTEFEKRLEKFGRETQRPIFVECYCFGRRRRLTRPALRGTWPASRSSSLT